MFFLHILILYHLLEEVIFTLYYLYTTTNCLDILEPFIEEVIPKERKDQYYDYSEVIEIDLILEEYFNAA